MACLDSFHFGNTSIVQTHFILEETVPTGTAKLGIQYNYLLHSGRLISIGAGYQASEYFKVVNLLYPTFRTGLEQTNTSLAIVGPYLTISIKGL